MSVCACGRVLFCWTCIRGGLFARALRREGRLARRFGDVFALLPLASLCLNSCRSISAPLPGAGVTFFAAAKKVTKESSFFLNRTKH